MAAYVIANEHALALRLKCARSEVIFVEGM
jgi:hypothetical protein